MRVVVGTVKWFKLLVVSFAGKELGIGDGLRCGQGGQSPENRKAPSTLSLSPRTGLVRPTGWEELP